MLTDPRVSACIVLYHSGAQVLDTVKCIMKSTVPIDLYIVDNSPEEPTAQVIKKMCPRAVVYPQKKNMGFGRANNVVLPNLKSTYHLIVNPDITFEPDLVQRMIDFMDAHKDIVILTPRVFNPDGTEQFLPKRRPSVHYLLAGKLSGVHPVFRRWREEYTLAGQKVDQPMTVDFATGCFLLIRTHYFYQLKGFDPRFFLYHEDSDLTLRAKQLGAVVYHPDMHVVHRWVRESSHSLRGIMMHIHSTVQFFSKWGWRW